MGLLLLFSDLVRLRADRAGILMNVDNNDMWFWQSELLSFKQWLEKRSGP